MRNGFLSTGYVPELGKVCSLMQLYQIYICYICTGYSSCDTLHRLGQISEFGTLRIHLILSVCLRASPEEQKNKGDAFLRHWKHKVPLALFALV